MKPVVLFGHEGQGYVVDPDTQRVDNPGRALDKHPFEATAAGVRSLLFAIVAPVALLVVGVIFHLIDRSTKGDLFPGNTIALICFIAAPIAFIALLRKATRMFELAGALPKRQTAEETVRTFLEAVDDRLWSRAYNCLTDSARAVGVVGLPREDYLQEMMPEVRVDSLESFKRFWSSIRFSFEPQWGLMRKEGVDARTEMVIVPLHATWTATVDGKAEARGEDFDCPFLAVQRGGFWFLASGFFWPEGQKYSSETQRSGGSSV